VKFRFRTLLHPTFIIVYIGVVLAHAMWNYNPYNFLGVPITILGALVFYIFAYNLYQLMYQDRKPVEVNKNIAPVEADYEI
jgi:hypothetical protein